MSKKTFISNLFSLFGTWLCVSGAVLFLLTACSWKSNQASSQTVVQVDSQTLSAKEFGVLLARKLKDFDSLRVKDLNTVNQFKEIIIRSFIIQAMIKEYAKTLNLEVSDLELEQEVGSVRSSYPDDLSFRQVLAEENLSLIDWKEELRGALLERKVFKKITENISPPKPEEVLRSYSENKEKFSHKERILLRQIVLDDLSKAESLHGELKNKDFATLAKKYSVAPEAKAGGLVGIIEKGTVDIFDKAFSLQTNVISKVLESPYGFHIFKVEKKEPAGIESFDSVKTRLYQDLLAQKEQSEFSSWLDNQIRTSRVLRNKELINSISIETKGDNK